MSDMRTIEERVNELPDGGVTVKMLHALDFVAPGHSLRMTVRLLKREGARSTIKFEGEVEGRPSVSGRLVLEAANLSDENPDLAELDSRMRSCQRETAAVLCLGLAASVVPAYLQSRRVRIATTSIVMASLAVAET